MRLRLGQALGPRDVGKPNRYAKYRVIGVDNNLGRLDSRIKKRKRASSIISSLSEALSTVLVIHYSCESFYDIPEGRTPRITSIAVRYLCTGQTKSFSIHKIAERRRIKIDDIEQHYDDLEREMLEEFFEFVRDHRTYKWIHWNMRDINYGFEAINNRYTVLGGNPERINDDSKIDLARLLVDMYGLAYIGHPRLERLIDKNKMTKKDFLTGAEEAQAFVKKEYVKLHQSTLRKVDIIATIYEKVEDGSLQSNARFSDVYGYSPQGIFDLAKENWLLSSILSVIGILIGVVVSKLLD